MQELRFVWNRSGVGHGFDVINVLLRASFAKK